MEKDIYDLELHERAEIFCYDEDYTNVVRVAGGWLYITSRVVRGAPVMATAFVPFNKEFKELNHGKEKENPKESS